MTEKRLNTRLVNKHDIQSNWEKAANFIPLQGEIIVYDIDDKYSYERIKIGDGVTNVNYLPFIDDGTIEDVKNAVAEGLAASKDYTDSQRLGYIEQNAITYDGNQDGRENFIYEYTFGGMEQTVHLYRIYDTIDPFAISGISSNFGDFSMDKIEFIDIGNESITLMWGGVVGVGIFSDNNKYGVSSGTYIIDEESDGTRMYIASIKFEAVHKINEKLIPATIARADEVAEALSETNAYINSQRLGYIEGEDKKVMPETTITINSGMFSEVAEEMLIEAGKTYIVNWNGVPYECVCMQYIRDDNIFVGNLSIYIDGELNTGEPFLLGYSDGYFNAITNSGDGDYNVSMYEKAAIHKIDPKFYDRLAWSEDVEVEIIPKFDAIYEGSNGINCEGAIGLKPGQTYVVNWDGVKYKCRCIRAIGDITFDFIGNPDLLLQSQVDGIPFLIIDSWVTNGHAIWSTSKYGTHTISISVIEEKIHQIEEKYIPNAVPKIETAEIGQTLVVKSVDENGKPTEWETMGLSFSEADALVLVVETGLVDIVSDESGAVLKDENDKFVII